MHNFKAEQIARVCPPFHWRLTAWLTASPYAAPEVQAELRDSLFNRMSSLCVSAVMIFALSVVVAIHHPTPWMIVWAALDGVFSVGRLALALVIMRYRSRHPLQAAPPDATPELYVLVGLLWCVTLGFGAGACLATGDPAISAIGSLVAMATMGAQCGRVPGAPRIVVAQFVLVSVPMCIGGCLAPDPFIKLVVVASPAYLVAMIGINRQLHRDFVELVAGRQESRTLALRCALTGLPNRRMFDRALSWALTASPAAASPLPVYVLCLDLDGFKAVNDELGHPVGDLLLKQVAARMVRLATPETLAARTGGDEFAVLARITGEGPVNALAQRLIAAMREPFLLIGHAPVRIGVSIGIACAMPGERSPDALMTEADKALYAAKRGGKNMLRWYAALDVVPAEPPAEAPVPLLLSVQAGKRW